MKCLALIPAHNETHNIEAAIRGVQNQTTPLDILVVCDNCQDDTATKATSMGVKVFETRNNTHKKAGALNQALAQVLDQYDFIMIQDADTVLAPNLMTIAIRQLEDRNIGAVCSRAGVKDICPMTWKEEFFWRMQRIEYGIFDSSRIETLGSIKVLHGMCTVYRTEALREVKARSGRIYDEQNITEDYELTICLKELGWKVTACLEMKAWTVVPLSLSELWTQRVRWFRGGVDVLRTHGLNRITASEFVQHGLFITLTSLNLIIMIALGYLIASGKALDISPLFWVVIGITTLDGLYRLRYVEHLHPKEILLRLLIVPFSLYMQLYQFQQLWAYWLSIRKNNQEW